MTTRRDIITSGLGLAGIIAAGKAPAALVRSMVAARGVAMGGGGGPSIWRHDGKIHIWYSLNDENFNNGDVYFGFRSITGTGTIDWGDGTTSTMTTNSATHTYANTGDYEVVVSGLTNYILGSCTCGYNNSQAVRIEFGGQYSSNNDRWFMSHFNLRQVNFNGHNSYCPEMCCYGDTLLESLEEIRFSGQIYYRAFLGCSSLKSIGDLTDCTIIEDGAFEGCTNLTSASNLRNCTSIGHRAFSECGSLESIGELTNCTYLAEGVFNSCSSLVFDVSTINGNLSGTFNGNIFRNCNNVYGELPRMDGIVSLANSSNSTAGCFRETKVSKIGGFPNATLGGFFFAYAKHLEEIGTPFTAHTGYVPEGCFIGCEKLKTISIPNATGCESWGFNFAYCNKLNSLILGVCTQFGNQSLKDIGISNEADASGIKCTVTVGNTMESLRGLGGFPFSAPTTTKFACADGYIVYENGSWTNHQNT